MGITDKELDKIMDRMESISRALCGATISKDQCKRLLDFWEDDIEFTILSHMEMDSFSRQGKIDRTIEKIEDVNDYLRGMAWTEDEYNSLNTALKTAATTLDCGYRFHPKWSMNWYTDNYKMDQTTFAQEYECSFKSDVSDSVLFNNDPLWESVKELDDEFITQMIAEAKDERISLKEYVDSQITRVWDDSIPKPCGEIFLDEPTQCADVVKGPSPESIKLSEKEIQILFQEYKGKRNNEYAYERAMKLLEK